MKKFVRKPRRPQPKEWKKRLREHELQQSIREAAKPVLVDFPYTYEVLQQAINLNGSDARIVFTVMYPEVLCLSRRIEVSEGEVREIAVSPTSLTQYVGREILFAFVGHGDDAEMFTIRVYKDKAVTLNFEYLDD